LAATATTVECESNCPQAPQSDGRWFGNDFDAVVVEKCGSGCVHAAGITCRRERRQVGVAKRGEAGIDESFRVQRDAIEKNCVGESREIRGDRKLIERPPCHHAPGLRQDSVARLLVKHITGFCIDREAADHYQRVARSAAVKFDAERRTKRSGGHG
jgi:hypothetical protein